MDFLLSCSKILDLPSITQCTAVVYYQKSKEYLSKNQIGFDDALLISTCLHLACKQTEISRKIRDIINVGYWLLRQDKTAYLSIDETYFKLRDSVTTSELIVLRILGYDLNIELAHYKLASIIHDLSPKSKSTVNLFSISNLAWALLNDSYLSRDIYSAEPIDLALAVCFMSVDEFEPRLISNFEDWVKKWEGSKHNVSTLINDVFNHVKSLDTTE